MKQYEEQLTALLNNKEQISPATEEALLRKITTAVSELIQHDFPKLIEILYRVDVNEKKLKEKIAQYPAADAAKIIAQMLLERQKQKLALRQSFRTSQDSISEEEKW